MESPMQNPVFRSTAAIPSRARVITISGSGGPEVLVPEYRDTPQPGIGEVLVQVAAAGVNRPDLRQRSGHYPPPPGVTDIPGLEISGTIVALGADVGEWSVGDRVCALVAGGGYAEFCVVPSGQCLLVPEKFSHIEAAALPETFFTVWHNLFERAALKAGETVLIHGGASGIGTTAIQLARAFGADVFVTAGTDEKCESCLVLGAREAFNYRAGDFVAQVAQVTSGRGVDVILDMVAGSYVARNLACLAIGGRLSIIALQGGRSAEIDLETLMRRRITITASTLRPQPVPDKARIAASLRSQVWPLLEQGRIKPIVHAIFPFDQAAAAHAELERGEHVGKVMLCVE